MTTISHTTKPIQVGHVIGFRTQSNIQRGRKQHF